MVVHHLKNLRKSYIAIGFSIMLLIITSFFIKKWWAFAVSSIVAYLIADLSRFIFKGGSGNFHVWKIGIIHQGYAYLILLSYIILGTLLTGYLGNFFVSQWETLARWLFLFINVIILFLVYSDLYFIYYCKSYSSPKSIILLVLTICCSLFLVFVPLIHKALFL